MHQRYFASTLNDARVVMHVEALWTFVALLVACTLRLNKWMRKTRIALFFH